MCKRHKMIEELVELKRESERAEKAYKEMCKSIIGNMNSSGIKTDEVEGVAKVTIAIPTKADVVACKAIPEWVEYKATETEAATARKAIEKEHRIDGTPSLRVTLK